jgi:two-component system, sensor histidine kinase PdtaS
MRLFDDSLRLANLRPWARYALTTVLVLLAFSTRYLLPEPGAASADPFLLFFPAIILAAMLFDRGSGLYAVILSAAIADYFVIEPVGSFAVDNAADGTALAIFTISAVATATLIESFHRVYHELSMVHRQLTAAHREMTQAHESVSGSERQKDILMQELTHRTKNDLMMVSSLVQMQSRSLSDEGARGILKSAAERIHVIGRVHDRLTRRAGSVVIDARDFLCGLCDDLRSTLVGSRPVALLCDAESHSISHAQAVSLGLIANELITNAVKYAFPDDRDGTIRLAFERCNGEFRLVVEDDGVGLPPPPPSTADGNPGTGQRLVRALALQLRGRFECVTRNPGTRFMVLIQGDGVEPG